MASHQLSSTYERSKGELEVETHSNQRFFSRLEKVTFSFPRNEETGEQKLSYLPRDVPKKYKVTWNGIDCQSIILVCPQPRETSTYVVASERPNEAAKGDPSASPVLVKPLRARGLPEAFIQKFPLNDAAVLRPGGYESGKIMIWHVILSTKSGAHQARSVWESVALPVFRALGICCKVYLTHSESTVSDLTRHVILPEANKGETQRVLILSGDGGMVDIVNTLLAEERSATFMKPCVALMPLGTGNALAHSTNSNLDDSFGFRSLWQGTAKELPVFRASFSPGARLLANEGQEERVLHQVDGIAVAYGAVVASWGLHAGLVADSDTTEYRKFGAERFKMAAKEALYPADGSPAHAYKGRISILSPGFETWQPVHRDQHAYVLATYCSHLEKGFNISPASKPLDGKFWLIHFGAMTGDEVMGLMTKAYQGGQHVQDERVSYQEIAGLRIDFEEEDAKWRRICIDGKIIRVERGGWVEVRSGANGVVDLVAV